jgi:hypothetical protein
MRTAIWLANPAAHFNPPPTRLNDRFDLSALQRAGSGWHDPLRPPDGWRASSWNRSSCRSACTVGRLQSAGHSLSLYGGSLEGSLNVAADDGRASYRGYLQNADLGPLLKDAGVRQKVGGTTNFFVDVSSKAGKPQQSAARHARPGPPEDTQRQRAGHRHRSGDSREWRGPLGTRQGARRPTGSGKSTAVGELTASFRIENGVARSTDLKPTAACCGSAVRARSIWPGARSTT